MRSLILGLLLIFTTVSCTNDPRKAWMEDEDSVREIIIPIEDINNLKGMSGHDITLNAYLITMDAHNIIAVSMHSTTLGMAVKVELFLKVEEMDDGSIVMTPMSDEFRGMKLILKDSLLTLYEGNFPLESFEVK